MLLFSKKKEWTIGGQMAFLLSLHITKTNIYNEKFSFYRIHYFTSIRSIL